MISKLKRETKSKFNPQSLKLDGVIKLDRMFYNLIDW